MLPLRVGTLMLHVHHNSTFILINGTDNTRGIAGPDVHRFDDKRSVFVSIIPPGTRRAVGVEPPDKHTHTGIRAKGLLQTNDAFSPGIELLVPPIEQGFRGSNERSCKLFTSTDSANTMSFVELHWKHSMTGCVLQRSVAEEAASAMRQ